MVPRASPPEGERRRCSVDSCGRLRKFQAALAGSASRQGSRDPEGAVQEALKRSLQNPAARAAIEFYFGDEPEDGASPPEWPLDQLFAWLHGVLRNVVREENGRASRWRELPIDATESEREAGSGHGEPADPAADPLDQLIHRELVAIVADAFPKLERDYRTVLHMRIDGLKYSDIADRLGVSQNTVATWVSRGIRELGEQIRRRTARARPSRGSGT